LLAPNERQEEGSCLFQEVYDESSLQGSDRPQSRELGGNQKSLGAMIETALFDHEQGRRQGSGIATDVKQFCSLSNQERVPK
jgi:hypothetical protein